MRHGRGSAYAIVAVILKIGHLTRTIEDDFDYLENEVSGEKMLYQNFVLFFHV
ncbi:hypothetical protein WN55_03516 [Dufourea novaeangliae]|uniref:Uncharacterized protein n=1 Tax=Dufourea novaeangliae TaxID=178035 RepID=A0A154PJF1_DUFNO|nr:hypothetical protein WN55_03516 [Dufourea novaeangliae]